MTGSLTVSARRSIPATVTPWTGGSFGALRIGLLGGSFNPAHEGHRHISLIAMARLGLDAVWWLVSPQNPLKAQKGMAPIDERIASAETTARHPRIVVTGVERQLNTRFTVDTVHRLKQSHPQCRFVWLMGADNLAQMDQWSRWRQLFHQLPIAIVSRRPYSLRVANCKAAAAFAAHRIAEGGAWTLPRMTGPAWVMLHGPDHPGSATSVRRGAPMRRRDSWTTYV
ncbi:nicotinate-nucleotide adenylyltransferase [Fodinicurvata sp. EGI_FJ10296]|uniref:nicotinate-nucleotide adenylyltransferase n=1 Tax=Fodinicurvata sp. EGI_FJ10296 TaxID=3231908 RepID=UPI0034547327